MNNEYYVIYLRKSRQDSEFETIEEVLERHETRLQDFAIRLTGKRIEEEHILREIISAETISDRPKMQKLLKLIKDENCKGVLVVDPQRLTRGDLIDLGNVIYAFQYSNTLVLTPERTFNLSDKYDREFFERELLRGKDYVDYAKTVMMRGREASAKAGYWVSSTAPYGYKRIKLDKHWSLVADEKEAEAVRMIFVLYVNENLGANLIAQRLNDLGFKPRMSERFSQTAVLQILKNEVYIGKIRWQAKPVVRVFEDGKVVKKRVRKNDYKLIDGKHEPIISTELFEAAQNRRGKMTREKVDTELRNIYAGLIKCKKCGGAIALRTHRKNGVVTRKDRYYCRSGVYCSNKSVNADVVQKVIVMSLKQHLEDFEVKIETDNKSEIEKHEKLISSLERQLIELEKRQDELYDLLESKTYTKEVFLLRNEKLANDRENLKEKIKNAKLNKPSIEESKSRYFSLHEALDALEDPKVSAKAKNIFLKEIIDVIWYEKNEDSTNAGSSIENTKFELEIVLK